MVFSILEQQGCEFVQASPPALELVSGIVGDVEDAVDAGLFQRVRVRPGVAAHAAASAPAVAPQAANGWLGNRDAWAWISGADNHLGVGGGVSVFNLAVSNPTALALGPGVNGSGHLYVTSGAGNSVHIYDFNELALLPAILVLKQACSPRVLATAAW